MKGVKYKFQMNYMYSKLVDLKAEGKDLVTDEKWK